MKWLQKLFGQGKQAPAAPTTLHRGSDGVYVLQIGGVLSKAMLDRIQVIAASDFTRGSKDAKVLLILKDFRGWKRGDDWGDLSFFAQYEQNIARIAVVGEPRWQTETLMFLGYGRRKGDVRYFTPDLEAQARDWLKS
jgi:hypothetical protein